MNIKFITLAAVTLALSTGTLFAKSGSDQQARMYQVERVHVPSGSVIKEGNGPGAVRYEIGDPHLKVTPEIWVYRTGFVPNHDGAKSDGCKELVIVFTDGQISNIYFANEKARQIVQTRAETGTGDRDAILAVVREEPDSLLAMN